MLPMLPQDTLRACCAAVLLRLTSCTIRLLRSGVHVRPVLGQRRQLLGAGGGAGRRAVVCAAGAVHGHLLHQALGGGGRRPGWVACSCSSAGGLCASRHATAMAGCLCERGCCAQVFTCMRTGGRAGVALPLRAHGAGSRGALCRPQEGHAAGQGQEGGEGLPGVSQGGGGGDGGPDAPCGWVPHVHTHMCGRVEEGHAARGAGSFWGSMLSHRALYWQGWS